MPRFLRSPLTPTDCRALIEGSLRAREQNFLRLVRRAIYEAPESPYRKLLRWAGVQYGDLERTVVADGIESTLERLLDAGVFITLEEFKGRRPIRRSNLTIDVTPHSFDNPVLTPEFEVESGGSTGPRRRMKIDLDLLVYDAACRYCYFAACGVQEFPHALWRAVPPDSSGLKQALIAAKLGRPVERWFTPIPVSWSPASVPFALVTQYALWTGERLAAPIPRPEHVPLDHPEPVARWLAEKAHQGTPAVLSAAAGNAVRAVISAQDLGLDLAGTVFRVGGEPLTEAKRRLIEQAGARTFSAWAMSETGPLGGACGNPEAIDEVHVFRGKVAVLQRPKILNDGQTCVPALYLTTLLTATPKIMLNVDTGDYGVFGRRRCGCLLEEIGFPDHLHTIRNYEKLTAGGIQFLGSDLIALVETVLPERHGGHPTDYQIVEEQEGALTKVKIRIHPRVELRDEEQVCQTVLRFLAGRDAGGRLMSAFWQQGGTLQVERKEPYVTPAHKTPPLVVMNK
ncbi:MAG: hypothetical protein RMK57_05235 [Bryobacterales bacterium]|nr:hypothetical protein [Bryobacteraceae bacterium]MDW8353918.1 hypothetical protein [Bryobacterales bacterium]